MCGVDFTQLVMILMLSFRDTSSFLVWELRLHTGVTYSALLSTIARAALRRVLAFAPQVDPDGHRMKLLLAITFPCRPSICCVYVSYLSSFTLRYLGSEL